MRFSQCLKTEESELFQGTVCRFSSSVAIDSSISLVVRDIVDWVMSVQAKSRFSVTHSFNVSSNTRTSLRSSSSRRYFVKCLRMGSLEVTSARLCARTTAICIAELLIRLSSFSMLKSFMMSVSAEVTAIAVDLSTTGFSISCRALARAAAEYKRQGGPTVSSQSSGMTIEDMRLSASKLIEAGAIVGRRKPSVPGGDMV